jgi:hypothetical protein
MCEEFYNEVNNRAGPPVLQQRQLLLLHGMGCRPGHRVLADALGSNGPITLPGHERRSGWRLLNDHCWLERRYDRLSHADTPLGQRIQQYVPSTLDCYLPMIMIGITKKFLMEPFTYDSRYSPRGQVYKNDHPEYI